ncbi:metallophosphoesterase 1 [Aplysia californica]|uniref:Metallophosphoesterase 1 n=1 Tax=Aplysia californica TaxID=6500 RepID=A0ABM0K043_APLCA|nr:metallophosphoesterase 1 [Aplysia californica]
MMGILEKRCFESVSRRLVRAVVIAFLFFLYCEVIHYCVVLLQCTWPSLPVSSSPRGHSKGQLKVMFIADTHLLGFRKGHWFDKLRREWQMKQAFQTSMVIHKPDVVFVLGDLLDEGKWCDDDEFNYHVSRFKSMFAVPQGTELHVVSGNHDEGFHYMITDHKHLRFERSFDSPSVRMLRIKNNIFVLVNSMAMEGDHCTLCTAAEDQLQKIATKLAQLRNCGKRSSSDDSCSEFQGIQYTKPVLLQHFPMYRQSDSVCNTEDSAPPEEKNIPFRLRYDCLDQRSSNQLFSLLQPRLVVSAHTHHGCYLVHPNGVPEWSVASFSWRNRNNPTLLLARIDSNHHVVSQCFMPKESTIMNIYILGGIVSFLSLFWPSSGLGRRKKFW